MVMSLCHHLLSNFLQWPYHQCNSICSLLRIYVYIIVPYLNLLYMVREFGINNNITVLLNQFFSCSRGKHCDKRVLSENIGTTTFCQKSVFRDPAKKVIQSHKNHSPGETILHFFHFDPTNKDLV